MIENPLSRILEKQGCVILDGGLSTELETAGHDLNHSLWSARLLAENPLALKQAHTRFLEAGADCIISSSYQASCRGLMGNGLSESQAFELIRKSFELAQESCDEFYASLNDKENRLKPIAAASIGPYGAFLADGSEYSGDYGLSVDELVDFHRGRFEILSDMSTLLAIETIPSLVEARALKQLLVQQQDIHVWVSFSCKNETHLADGHFLKEAVALFSELPQVVAIGTNCCKPKFVAGLISNIKKSCGEKEIVVYANRGEDYCATSKTWIANTTEDVNELSPKWLKQGARLIGGCCRISSKEIATLRNVLVDA